MATRCRRTTISVVDVTALIPSEWNSWFYAGMANRGDVTWGDADMTLIGIHRFTDICHDVMADHGCEHNPALERVLGRLKLKRPLVYVNLEN